MQSAENLLRALCYSLLSGQTPGRMPSTQPAPMRAHAGPRPKPHSPAAAVGDRVGGAGAPGDARDPQSFPLPGSGLRGPRALLRGEGSLSRGHPAPKAPAGWTLRPARRPPARGGDRLTFPPRRGPGDRRKRPLPSRGGAGRAPPPSPPRGRPCAGSAAAEEPEPEPEPNRARAERAPPC